MPSPSSSCPEFEGKPAGVTLRWGGSADHDALGEVMFDAVRNGPSPYSDAQRMAWVGAPPKGEKWNERLDGQEIAVAEQGNRLVAFMTLDDHGYIDFAFVRPEWRGRGVFGQMLTRIQERARAKREPRLWVHASLMAEPAFRAHDFTIVRRESVTVGGESLERVEMEKILAEAASR